MSQNKEKLKVFGFHVLVWRRMEKFIARKCPALLPSDGRCDYDDLLCLTRMAEHPEHFSMCHPETQAVRRRHARLYANYPDEVIRILAFLRRELLRPKATAASKAREFILRPEVERVEDTIEQAVGGNPQKRATVVRLKHHSDNPAKTWSEIEHDMQAGEIASKIGLATSDGSTESVKQERLSIVKNENIFLAPEYFETVRSGQKPCPEIPKKLAGKVKKKTK